MKTHKKVILVFLMSLKIPFLMAVIILFSYYSVSSVSEEYIYDNPYDVKPQKVGLVLGTNPMIGNGYKNYYFYYRIDAAVDLYNAGKIKYIIVSGDNSRKDYNEPEAMKQELVRRGIPEDVIFLDYAGFRTLDSVIRAKEIFGQTSFIVISQKFHNERAVFLARVNGIDAYAYNAKDVGKSFGFKTHLREYGARVKVYIDLVFGVDPKFLGEKIEVK